MAIDSAAKAVGGTALKPLQREAIRAFVVVRPGKVDYSLPPGNMPLQLSYDVAVTRPLYLSARVANRKY